MKPYLVYKKQLSRARALDSGQSLKLLLLLVVLLLVPLFFVRAETAEELQNKIREKDADIAALEAEINTYQGQLTNLGKQKTSLASSIKQLDLTRKKLVADITVTQKKIDKTNLAIQGLSSDISDKEDSISTNTDSIALGFRRTNELELDDVLETLLSKNDFSMIWDDIDDMITVRERLRDNIVELREVKFELEDTRAKTIEAKKELTSLKSKLADQQKIVTQNTNEKNKLLQQTKNSEANYQKLLKERLAQRLAFEKELRDYEAQLQFVLDPSKLPKGRILSWPLDKIFVTSPYAPRWGGFHRGTDFRASVGTQIKAMANGVVKGTGDTDICCPGASFGKWIFIEHTNGLSSTYAHLSLISVSKDQKVARGQVIGYSGNTGSSTGPHLHVSLYVSSGVKVDSFPSKSYPGKTLIQPISATGAYLDPMKYLPPL